MEESPRMRSGLTKEETRTSLEAFNWSATFRGVFDTICAATTFVFAGFVLSAGIPKEKMGFINSVVSLACIIQILSLLVLNRIEDKRRFVLSVALAEPLLMIAGVMAIPFLPQSVRIYALIVVVFMAAASLHLTRPVADDWLAATIPVEVRGRYLGRRFQFLTLSIIVTTLAAGQIAERIGKANTLGLALILAAGGVFGILSVLALRKATMPAVSANSRIRWGALRETWENRLFRRYISGLLIYNIPFYLAVPYYQVFNLKILHMRESVIAYMMAGYSIVKILTAPFCGRWLDRLGPRLTLYLCGPVYVLFFAAFTVSTPDRTWPVIVAWCAVGFTDAAYTILIASALYASVPHSPSRPAYFAINNLVGLATYGAGSLLAVPILEALEGVNWRFGPLQLDQFHAFFAGCTLLMIPCILSSQFFVGRGKVEG